MLTTSEDGVNWSTPERVPIDPVTSTADHFIAGLGVLSGDEDDHGDRAASHTKLALTYYYLPDGKTCFPEHLPGERGIHLVR